MKLATNGVILRNNNDLSNNLVAIRKLIATKYDFVQIEKMLFKYDSTEKLLRIKAECVPDWVMNSFVIHGMMRLDKEWIVDLGNN